ncbi:peptidase inhibitor family I36 protein [Streptomyces resistomycificus]|uniref:peptidase inhibitor family I36 protein n=1 Tax=Streptomyces resistomycificus TaxID=67356 RepID=UPI000A4C8CAE|nr:peptidase inhibitor family I36 protein [Streptomyces resistomycificus]
MRSARLMTAAIATATLGVLVSTGAAQAQPSAGHGLLASYQGKTIDLSKDWQGAHTCAVFTQDDIRCYSSAAAGENDWLCLYQYKKGEGKRLIFKDEHWQNLDDYGFDNKTSSWRNRQGSGDTGKLAQYENGSSSGWNIKLSAKGYVSDMGSKDNQASSVHG